MITVYGLTDEHGQIRYVGQTTNPVQRFRQHRSSQTAFEVSGMAKLAEMEEWDEAEEAKWIAFFGLDNLLNRLSGASTSTDVEPEPEIVEIICDSCGTAFLPKRPWQRFDTQQCHDRHHNLLKQAILKKARDRRKGRAA